MNDHSEMPFGKYKGRKHEQVPASYFLWLWDNGVWADSGHVLHSYIKNAFSARETEADDYLVIHRPE